MIRDAEYFTKYKSVQQNKSSSASHPLLGPQGRTEASAAT